MKFETRRERETRRKRQKQSAILGMVLAFALVMIMGAVIWSGKRTLEKQNKEYQARVAQLQEQVEEQQNRSDEIDKKKNKTQHGQNGGCSCRHIGHGCRRQYLSGAL